MATWGCWLASWSERAEVRVSASECSNRNRPGAYWGIMSASSTDARMRSRQPSFPRSNVDRHKAYPNSCAPPSLLEATLERTSSEHPWWSPLGRHQRELPELTWKTFPKRLIV